MSKRGFFGFAVGTAAAAAGVWLVKKKGGVHITVDVDDPKLGESVTEWKAKHASAQGGSDPEAGDFDDEA